MAGFRGLTDRRVLLTGGASGIGRATALRLGEEGCRVGILDLDGDGAEATARDVERAGGHAAAFAVDITDAAAVAGAVERFEAEAGPIEGLVNNAGWDLAADFLDTDAELWRKIVEINLFGPLHVTKAVLPGMVARSGVTLNVISPGPSDTPLFASFDPTGKLAAALERAIPMRRLGQPDDYPGLVAFLLSDDAAFITGQTVSVSGGLTMHG